MSDPRPTRSSQPITTRGLGRHFTSPLKKRDKKRSRLSAPIPGNASKRRKLDEELEALLATPFEPKRPPPTITIVDASVSPIFREEEPLEGSSMELEDFPVLSDGEDASHSTTAQNTRTTCPTARSISTCAGWKALIPTIVDPFLKYTAATVRQPLVALGPFLTSCTSSCQEQKVTAVLCLFFDRK